MDHQHTRLRAALGVAALLLLAACAATNPDGRPPRTVQDGDNFTLDVSEEVAVRDGGRILYLALASDSRCPADVQCVWAGVAEIRLRWTPDGAAAEEFSLTTETDGASRRIGAHVLSLQSLDRGAAPRAQLALTTAPE
jgi:hypothetical protein